MSSKVMMEELKERLSTHQMRVSIFMVFTLKDLAGTDQRRDLRTPTLRSFTINSQFSMSPPFPLLFQLVVLQELAKLLETRQLKLRNFSIHAQFTNIQWETIDISSSELESKLKQQVLLKDQTRAWQPPWNGNSVVSASFALRIEQLRVNTLKYYLFLNF